MVGGLQKRGGSGESNVGPFEGAAIAPLRPWASTACSMVCIRPGGGGRKGGGGSCEGAGGVSRTSMWAEVRLQWVRQQHERDVARRAPPRLYAGSIRGGSWYLLILLSPLSHSAGRLHAVGPTHAVALNRPRRGPLAPRHQLVRATTPAVKGFDSIRFHHGWRARSVSTPMRKSKFCKSLGARICSL